MPHLAFAAFFAMAFRLAGDSFAARAFPPFAAPNFESATAAGFLPASRSMSGDPSICSPIACSTTRRATAKKSRAFSLGTVQSCHESRADAMPVEIKLTHYQISAKMAEVMCGMIGPECGAFIAAIPVAASPIQNNDDLDYWEHRLEQDVVDDESIPETDRQALIRARRGQGLFKQRVMQIERRCRVTGVEKLVHLVASHCKPWRDSSNEERLNGENGLLLTPTIDHLFDRGFIGFEDNGGLIISPVADRPSLQRMGIDGRGITNVGGFTEGQKHFLDFHRNSVLLMRR